MSVGGGRGPRVGWGEAKTEVKSWATTPGGSCRCPCLFVVVVG